MPRDDTDHQSPPGPSSPLTARLLARIDAYAERAKISPARVATLAVNDGDWVRRVRAGGTFTVATFEKFMAWLDSREGEADQRECA